MQQAGQAAAASSFQSPMHGYGSSIILLTNPENELYKMELALRGMIMDKDGKPHSVGDPLMNDEGINSVMGQTQAIVNQITIMSNLTKYEVPMMIDFLGDTIAKDLMVNREKYHITNYAARDKIYFLTLSTAFITMKRAFEEGDKRFWKGATQEITTRVEGQQKKGNFFTQALGWGQK